MIAHLRGRLLSKEANRLVIDVGGVGYEVQVPLTVYYRLGDEGSEVSLQIYTHVREDALSLYGFSAGSEKRLFELLISISGIGPRLGITILSGLPAEELAEAVASGDLVRLTAIPGIGKKTAERILLELQEKMNSIWPEMAEAASPSLSGVQRDVVSALVNLGYPRRNAERTVSRAAEQSETVDFEGLLRSSLRELTS